MKHIRTFLIMMMVAMLSSVVLAAATNASKVDPKILDVLEKVQANINSSDYLSYHVAWTQVMMDRDDGTSHASMTVWLKKMPEDKYFGAYFHSQGTDFFGNFDYFYDGKTAFDIRDKNKQITVFHMRELPGVEQHPAKTRTGAHLVLNYLYDRGFEKTILANHVSASIADDPEDESWLISVHYRRNKIGIKKTTLYKISKKTNLLERVHTDANWQGSEFKTTYELTGYSQQKQDVASHINMPGNYKPDFKRESYKIDYVSDRPSSNKLIGKEAPNFQCRSFSGKMVSLNEFRGRLVLLDFWESWCGPCRLALPHTNELQKKWKGRLVVIGVVSANEKEVRKIIKTENLSYINVLGDKKLLKRYKINGFPTYYLIDRDGKVLDAGVAIFTRVKTKIQKLASEHEKSAQSPQPNKSDTVRQN